MRGDTAEVMTAEIAAARTARLDYWAFLAYDEADPMTAGCSFIWRIRGGPT